MIGTGTVSYTHLGSIYRNTAHGNLCKLSICTGTRYGTECIFCIHSRIRNGIQLGICTDSRICRRNHLYSFVCDKCTRSHFQCNPTEQMCIRDRYTTDAISAAVFEEICNRANVPYQIYVNRSDILGGSTLGNISTTQVPVNTVDIGLAQLAMHSP